MKKLLFFSLFALLFVNFTTDNIKVAKHKYYTSFYDFVHNQPLYVVYGLNKNMVSCKDGFDRETDFIPDPILNTPDDNVYKKTGYDRGHLMAAEDGGCDLIGMKESFFTSNICPQSPKLNRGQWKSLEINIRNVAKRKDTLTIITGPMPDFSKIGKLYVCKYFFKIVIDNKKGLYKAWIIPNTEVKLFQLYEITDDKLLPNYIYNYTKLYKNSTIPIKNF